MNRIAAELPPITDHHLRIAFQKLHWTHLTYDQVMAGPIRSKLVEVCAHQLRRDEFDRNTRRTVVPIKRVRLGVDGHPIGWCTQMAPIGWERDVTPDLFKR